MKLKTQKMLHEKGFVGLYLTIVVLILMLGIIASIGFGVLAQQRIAQNIVQSAQAYAAAESGVEDALIRLANGQNVCDPPGSPPCSNTLQVAGASATTTVSDIVAGSRTIIAEGDSLNRIRTTQVVYEISSSVPGFHYGAQVGDGGMYLDNNAIVDGNVFSNGDITGGNGSQASGTVQIAGVGKKLNNVDVKVDAYVDICENNGTTITGVLHANTPGSCNYGSWTSGLPIDPIPLPIADSEILQWQNEADDGSPLGNVTVTNTNPGVDLSLGPKKITGELIVDNNATLELTGTLWVVGKVTIKNGAIVQLSPGYGTMSGMIISDNIVLLDNTSVSTGGQPGRYLMYISTSTSSQAIEAKNGSQSDILYTNTGTIKLDNNAKPREIVGYRIELSNNAVVTYETGLQTAAFTSGPGGGWTVTSWKEVE
ncbi:MAG TPA: pilus assembly PilX N-terminal domain-containing protein [Candidatus Paceibacterota bacterium]